MLFIMSNEDDRIVQANKVYTDVENYERQLLDKGIAFTKLKHHSLLSPERWMTTKTSDSLMRVRQRPIMPVVIDKTIIKAGGTDKAVIIGAPKDTAYSITGAGSIIASGTLPDGEIEISIPCVLTYDVMFMKWPWQECHFKIEAIA
jgi:hypothetical protein